MFIDAVVCEVVMTSIHFFVLGAGCVENVPMCQEVKFCRCCQIAELFLYFKLF